MKERQTADQIIGSARARVILELFRAQSIYNKPSDLFLDEVAKSFSDKPIAKLTFMTAEDRVNNEGR